MCNIPVNEWKAYLIVRALVIVATTQYIYMDIHEPPRHLSAEAVLNKNGFKCFENFLHVAERPPCPKFQIVTQELSIEWSNEIY